MNWTSIMTLVNHIQMTTPRSARFWDRIAKRYARSTVSDETSYQKKLAQTRALLTPDMQLLEFGCGTGSTALIHAPYVKHILATDISARMVEIARQKASDRKIENITFQRAALDDLTERTATYDIILGMSILHLVENRDAAIAKTYDMLKPGGSFVSSTACLGDSLKFFKLIAPLGRILGLLPMLRVFTTSELVNSLKAAGFIIDTQWSPGKNKSVFVIARKPQ
jgi:2-polyprenyl-3-methyl-5-hydroxy-6-metoxy-1,4-benzoquinol methylase